MMGHSLAPHTHSLAPYYSLCSRAPLRSLVRSITKLAPELVGQWNIFVRNHCVLNHCVPLAISPPQFLTPFFYQPPGSALKIAPCCREEKKKHWTFVSSSVIHMKVSSSPISSTNLPASFSVLSFSLRVDVALFVFFFSLFLSSNVTRRR